MYSVRIEHGISDFDTWKVAFDRDPVGRARSGVRRYRVSRPVGDPAYVMIDLDFDSLDAAEAFVTAMRGVWQSAQAAAALRGVPQARIVEAAESHEY